MRKGSPATSTSGFGVFAPRSPSREPGPPARMQTGGSDSGILSKAVSRLDDVLRSLASLVVDAPDVLAHDAERQQLDAAEERHEDDDRRVADRERRAGEL